MKSRIAELERENESLRQQINLALAEQSTQPSQSQSNSRDDLSSNQSIQWDQDGELGSMILEANFLPHGDLKGYSSLDSTSTVDELSRLQLSAGLGSDVSSLSQLPENFHTLSGSSLDAKEDTSAMVPHPMFTRCTQAGNATNATNALHLATASGNSKCVEILLEHGFDVNSIDTNGRTALMHASSLGSADLIRLLLDRGADGSVRAPDGYTALEIAAQLGNANALSALLTSQPSKMMT